MQNYVEISHLFSWGSMPPDQFQHAIPACEACWSLPPPLQKALVRVVPFKGAYACHHFF